MMNPIACRQTRDRQRPQTSASALAACFEGTQLALGVCQVPAVWNSARCTRNSKVLKSQKILRWYIQCIYCYFYIFQLTLALFLFVAAPHFMAICTWPRLTPLKASHDSHGIQLSRGVGRARSPPNISPSIWRTPTGQSWFSLESCEASGSLFFLSRPVKWEAHGRTSQNASSQLHSGMAPGISKMRHCTRIYLMQKELLLKKVFNKCPAA